MRIKYLVAYLSVLVAISHLGLNIHRSVIPGVDGQILQVCLRHGHQRHIAEDAVWLPVVVIVEVAPTKLRYHAHGELLLFNLPRPFKGRGKIICDVKHRRVKSRPPRPCFLAINPQVVAIQHTVKADDNPLPFPFLRHSKLCAIVSRQWLGMMICRLAESIRLPASRHRYHLPCIVSLRHGLIIRDAIHNLQVPLAIQALFHLRISHRQHALKGIHHLRLNNNGQQPQPGNQ